jgi:hypothetical protein
VGIKDWNLFPAGWGYLAGEILLAASGICLALNLYDCGQNAKKAAPTGRRYNTNFQSATVLTQLPAIPQRHKHHKRNGHKNRPRRSTLDHSFQRPNASTENRRRQHNMLPATKITQR